MVWENDDFGNIISENLYFPSYNAKKHQPVVLKYLSTLHAGRYKETPEIVTAL